MQKPGRGRVGCDVKSAVVVGRCGAAVLHGRAEDAVRARYIEDSHDRAVPRHEQHRPPPAARAFAAVRFASLL